MNNKIIIGGAEYNVLDAKECITIPDCFVKDSNKIHHSIDNLIKQ